MNAPSPPALLRSPLFASSRQLADQKWHLPGPTPLPDLACMLHVSGFPQEARTDDVLRPLSAVCGPGTVRFHWIDITSGVAECASPEAARLILEAIAAATASRPDGPSGEAKAPKSDSKNLRLEDLCVAPIEATSDSRGGDKSQTGGGDLSSPGEKGETRSRKRPREEGEEPSVEPARSEA